VTAGFLLTEKVQMIVSTAELFEKEGTHRMEPLYKNLGNRTPDTSYKDSLKRILLDGEQTRNPYQTKGRKALLTLSPMVFMLDNGFPVITERKVGFWRKPIGELLAFIHGVRDARELADKWGVNWWRDQWATPEKCADFGLEPYDMGPGSYGASLCYTLPNGQIFRQYEHLIAAIKERPDVITHKVTTWIPHYCLGHKGNKRQVVVAPCHGDVEVTIIGNELTLRMDQRSADFPIGVPSNIIQYAALTIMIAHVTGYTPHRYIHSAHNAQIYDDQIDATEELIQRESFRFPSMHLTDDGKKIKNIFDFRPDHFELRDYISGPAMGNIPVTV